MERSCKDVLTMLSDYFDLDLPAEACAQIDNHLAECSPCEEFAASLRKTVELCRGYQPAAMPAPLKLEAREQLAEAYKRMLAERK